MHDALVTAVVFATSYLGITLITREGGVAPIWIADAFIVFFVLRKPRSETPRIAAARLRLALVRSLAELHGGSLKIESVEGHGTTMTVAIPAEYKASLAA